MSGDYSRKRFNPENHYQGVLQPAGTESTSMPSGTSMSICRTAAGAPRPSTSSAAAACRGKLRMVSRCNFRWPI